MMQVGFSGVVIPSDPFVPCTQAKHRVSKSKQPNKFSILFIDHKEAEAATIPRGNRDAPMEARITEKELIIGIGLYLYESRPDLFRHYLSTRRNALKKPRLESNESVS